MAITLSLLISFFAAYSMQYARITDQELGEVLEDRKN